MSKGVNAESLKNHFCHRLNEKSKRISKIPLHQQFIEIKKLLQPDPKSHTSLVPPESLTTESMESLNNAFEDCKNLSKRNYKDDQYTEKELIFINTKRMMLNQIREKLSEAIGKAKSLGDEAGASEKTEEEATQLTTRSVDPTKVFGFDGKVKAVEKLLLKEESKNQLKALGMIGMKGIGKTTLCRVLFNKQEVKSHFLPRIWICMSKLRMQNDQQEPDHKFVVVERLLSSLGVNKEILKPRETDDQDKKLALAKLVYALNLKLRGKKYLIVLDGAVDNEDWYQDLHLPPPQGIVKEKWGDRLAYGLPKEHGGAVIVTSRSEEVAEKMVRKENLYSLLPLADTKSCWSIFKKEGFKDKPVNEVLKYELANEEFRYELEKVESKNEPGKEGVKTEPEKEEVKNEPAKEGDKNEPEKEGDKTEPAEKEGTKNEPSKEEVANEQAKLGEVKLKELKEELKQDIKRESAGVPLAAKMLGEIFYQKNKEKMDSKSGQTPKKEEEDSKTQIKQE